MDIASLLRPFLGILGNEIFLAILFVLFVVILFRIFKLMTEIVAVAVISALFPLFLSSVLKIHIALTPNTFLFFIVLGVGLLLAYKAFSIVKAPFKILGTKMGLLLLAAIALAAVWYFFFSAPAEPGAIMQYADRNCTTAEDCTFARIDCCDFCNAGMPVNKRSFELINSEKQKTCEFARCPYTLCVSPQEASGGILPSPITPACISQMCSVELNCTVLCNYIASGETGFINSTASNIYLNVSEVESLCSC